MEHTRTSAGDLNYILTRIVNGWMDAKRASGPTRYEHIAAGIGALECAKFELYRKRGAVVEDRALVANGPLPIEGYGGG